MCTTHCKMLAFLLYLLGFTVQLTVALKQWPGQNCSEMAFGDGQYLRVCGSEYVKLKCNLHPQPPYSLSKEMNFTAVWTSSIGLPVIFIHSRYSFEDMPVLDDTKGDLCLAGEVSEFKCPLLPEKTYVYTRAYNLGEIGAVPGRYTGEIDVLSIIGNGMDAKKAIILSLQFNIKVLE